MVTHRRGQAGRGAEPGGWAAGPGRTRQRDHSYLLNGGGSGLHVPAGMSLTVTSLGVVMLRFLPFGGYGPRLQVALWRT